MSIPRVLLAPTHHTGLANAVAATVAEIITARGQQVRYHHVGPIGPVSAWDRWEGTAFLDPALYSEEALLGLYEAATRNAQLSLLSCTAGLLDRRDGVKWLPTDLARLLDCPVVVVMDCRKWGTGIRLLTTGLKSNLSELNLAGAVLSGVADREHFEVLRQVLAEGDIPVVGCLFERDGPGWDASAPGAWNLPLDSMLLEAVARQVDIKGLTTIAGQRGFLSSQSWLTDRSIDGPVVAVAGGGGFTLWSRDSIEVLRSAGAQVRRLDLSEDTALPDDTAGLVLAGTLWPTSVPDVAMNTSLLRAIHDRIGEGMPTVALGGGMLPLLSKVQDTLGRRAELAGVIPAESEILWDLEEPAYVTVTAERDNLLMAKGETVTGWVLTETEMASSENLGDPPLAIRGGGVVGEKLEGVSTDSLLCSRVFMHLAATSEMAPRFVRRCAAYAARHR